MKKLIFMLFFSIGAFAQPYVSGSLDARNAAVGSAPTNNKSEVDLLFRFGAIGTAGVGKNVKVGIVYEKFNAIDFNKYAVEVGYTFNVLNLDVHASLEAGWIERFKLNYWTAGTNVDVIYFINENIGIMLTNNLSARADLNSLYGGENYKFSNYIGIIYKFKDNSRY